MKRFVILTILTLSACYESSPYQLGREPTPAGPWSTNRDGFWEGFERGEIDLQGYALSFVPTLGSVWTYRWAAGDGVRDFPFRPGNGTASTVLELGDDDYTEYRFQVMDRLTFFGERYSSMYVGSNGYVTFGQGSSSLSDSPEEHFASPGVAALRGDLNPRSDGEVIVDEWDTRVVVTYQAVPGYGETTPNDVQLVLHDNGVIEFHYLTITSQRNYLVGISNGLPGRLPSETDFVSGPATTEHCGDAVDNDGDGLIDCDDPDCADDTRFCLPGREVDCHDGRDNDGDGLTDCDDPDCDCPFAEVDCFDGIDNDGDGFTDCDDWDCEEECWDREWDCHNGWDDDGDGLIDCDDPDCEGECADWEVDCFDGIDNDGDGFTDCDDWDCEEECGDRERDCRNGWDDDRDGDIDCDDSDCFGRPEACEVEINCRDGADNDADGDTDCDDEDCWGTESCISECFGPWQTFERDEEIDLAGVSLTFVPDRSDPNGYRWAVSTGPEEFPVSPGTGARSEVLELSDDDFEPYDIRLMTGLSFYALRYDTFYVSSNGYVTFRRGSGSLSPSPEEHFFQPGIAALRGDLDPRRGGFVVVDEFPDHIAVTWEGVPWYGRDSLNSFQIVIRSSGVVELHYLDIADDNRRFLVGLSNGCGGLAVPPAVDFVAATPERCDDGWDNDGDGYTDCDDWDCFGEPPLCVFESNCGDGHDNDRDGAVDCDDPDCSIDPRCEGGIERDCDDRWDNDGDGLTDCEDPDCAEIPPCTELSRGYWELFNVWEGEAFDLEESLLIFVPDDAEPNGYTVFHEPGFPFFLEAPGAGDRSRVLDLSDDSYADYTFEVFDGAELYGERYGSMFVSSNGYVTFVEGSSDLSATPAAHFRLPSVAAYRTDLDPRAGGTVTVDEWFDHVVVTFEDVPFFGRPPHEGNSFQIVFMDDGSIALLLLEIAGEYGGLVGISDGAGGRFPAETDFSEL